MGDRGLCREFPVLMVVVVCVVGRCGGRKMVYGSRILKHYNRFMTNGNFIIYSMGGGYHPDFSIKVANHVVWHYFLMNVF